MKKHISLFLLISFLVTFNLYAQVIQDDSWSDGYPEFSKNYESQGVEVGSTIHLIPLSDTHVADSFKFILDGKYAVWPTDDFPINEAYDVDYINEMGNLLYLVTDGADGRVFEINFIDPEHPAEVFDFSGHVEPLVRPYDASIFYEDGNRKILITDNGGHQVIKFDPTGGDQEWSYGVYGEAGGRKNQLSGPTDAIALPDTTLYLIADQGNGRVILVNSVDTSIVWYYGTIDPLHPTINVLDPRDIEYEASTNSVLITDQGTNSEGKNNHRVFQISIDDSSIIWQFGTGQTANTDSTLNSPTDADFLENGNILICDAGNNRLIEVDRSGEIVWSYEHPPLINLYDADRLPDNRTIIVADNTIPDKPIPIWLGYADSIFVSDVQSLGKKANFESITWSAQTPANTQVRLQIRSADNLTDLQAAPWYGPSDSDSFFVTPSDVNQTHHRLHSYYQFRASLKTNDVLTSPILNDFQVQYQYYDETVTGTVTSEVISGTYGSIITSWESLDFRTITQSERRNIKISILDATTEEVLHDFYAADLGTNNNHEILTMYDNLKEDIQAVKLRATLNTNNTATTPILDNWQINWKSTVMTSSQIYFVDEDRQPVTYYRASETDETEVDRVNILLIDQNLAALQETIELPIRALRNGDQINALLKFTYEGEFINDDSGIRTIVSNVAVPTNNSLEVFDRDTLVISYTDPTTPTDQCSDSILIIQNTTGELQIVDALSTPIDTVAFDDTIYVSITGEMDQNITNDQDTIWVEVFDSETHDSDTLWLIELAENNNYYTGNFFSSNGLVVAKNSFGIKGDSLLQTWPGNLIGAEYLDNVTLQDFVPVEPGSDHIDTVQAQPVGAIDFDVAPNPFIPNPNSTLKLRVSSSLSDLKINQIEIYNLAGLRVCKITNDQLPPALAGIIPMNNFIDAGNWWNLKNDNDNHVSSGTYWVKMYCSLITGNGGSSNDVTSIKKLVIIR